GLPLASTAPLSPEIGFPLASTAPLSPAMGLPLASTAAEPPGPIDRPLEDSTRDAGLEGETATNSTWTAASAMNGRYRRPRAPGVVAMRLPLVPAPSRWDQGSACAGAVPAWGLLLGNRLGVLILARQ